MRQELAGKTVVGVLTGGNLDLRELAKRRGGPDTMPEALQRQLEVARARLEVYESAPLPYSAEETAFLKKPDLTASVSTADAAPRRALAARQKTREQRVREATRRRDEPTPTRRLAQIPPRRGR